MGNKTTKEEKDANFNEENKKIEITNKVLEIGNGTKGLILEPTKAFQEKKMDPFNKGSGRLESSADIIWLNPGTTFYVSEATKHEETSYWNHSIFILCKIIKLSKNGPIPPEKVISSKELKRMSPNGVWINIDNTSLFKAREYHLKCEQRIKNIGSDMDDMKGHIELDKYQKTFISFCFPDTKSLYTSKYCAWQYNNCWEKKYCTDVEDNDTVYLIEPNCIDNIKPIDDVIVFDVKRNRFLWINVIHLALCRVPNISNIHSDCLNCSYISLDKDEYITKWPKTICKLTSPNEKYFKSFKLFHCVDPEILLVNIPKPENGNELRFELTSSNVKVIKWCEGIYTRRYNGEVYIRVKYIEDKTFTYYNQSMWILLKDVNNHMEVHKLLQQNVQNEKYDEFRRMDYNKYREKYYGYATSSKSQTKHVSSGKSKKKKVKSSNIAFHVHSGHNFGALEP